MNDELEKLRPEVRRIAGLLDDSLKTRSLFSDGWQTIRAELLRLAKEVDRRFGIGGELIAARRERDEAQAELAALKARIAGSVELTVGDPAWSDGTLSEMDGLRVALVKAEE